MVKDMYNFLITNSLAPYTTLSKIKGGGGEMIRLLNNGTAEVWKGNKCLETRDASEEERKIMMASWEEIKMERKGMEASQEAYRKELEEGRMGDDY
jgi:hypothetical protein